MIVLRRKEKRGDDELAWRLLAEAPAVYVAMVGDDPQGAPEPLLRPLHAVVVGRGDARALAFHGAPAGEKLQGVGRRAVVMAHEVVVDLPSTFSHPEKACPATTLYRSASAHGTLRAVTDPARKAEVLQALMARYQPEGGYRPITHDDPLYASAVRGLAVWSLRPDRVVAKVSLAQHKRAAHRARLVEQLWARGRRGDVRAAQAIVDAAPLQPLPELLRGPYDTTLVLAADRRHVDEAVALLRDQYWNTTVDDATLAAAQPASTVWMVLLHGDTLVATARGLSDGHKSSYVMDVAVDPAWRGRGLGRFLVQRLVDHPRLRGTRVDLLTRDAGPFYEGLGFRPMPWSQPWRHSP